MIYLLNRQKSLDYENHSLKPETRRF